MNGRRTKEIADNTSGKNIDIVDSGTRKRYCRDLKESPVTR